MGTPANGVFSRYFPRTARLVNEIAHPVDTLEGVLGIGKPVAPPTTNPYMLHNDPDIAAANQSYRNAQQDTPMAKVVRGALTKKK